MLQKVSFYQKIWSGIAVIVLMLLISGGASLFNLLSIDHSNSRVGDTAVPALFVANDAQIKLLKLVNLSTKAASTDEEGALREASARFHRQAAAFEAVLAELQDITREDPALQPLAERIAVDYEAFRKDASLMMDSRIHAVVEAERKAIEAADDLQDSIDRLGQVYADIQNHQPLEPAFRADALDAAHAAAGVDMYLQNITRLLESVRKATRSSELANLQADVAGELVNTTGQFEASVTMKLERIGQQRFIDKARLRADELMQEIMREDNFIEMKDRHLQMVERSRQLADKANVSVSKAVEALDSLLAESKSVFGSLRQELDHDVGFGLASTGVFTGVLLFLPLLVFLSMLRAIQRKISDLASINTMGKKLANAKSVESALQETLDGLKSRFVCAKGAIFLASIEELKKQQPAYVVCHDDKESLCHNRTINQELILQAAERGMADFRIVDLPIEETGYAEGLQMAVPLVDDGHCEGVLYLAGPAREAGFSETDIEMVSAIANTLVVAIKKIRMMEITEAQNHQLRRMDELKDEFLANTSHELRTPLNGIIGLAEASLFGEGQRLSNSLRDNLRMIVTSGRRLGSLVNDILDFSKLRHEDIVLNPRAVDAGAMVEVVLTLSRPLTRDKPVELVNAVPQGLPVAWCDENRLQQILHNLVGNACKFTREGRVTVSADVREERLWITVTDTGIGIPADRLDSVFESFNQGDGSIQREFGGTGLGLSITRKLVELHGGEIRVSSTPGEGSSFCFSLPLASAMPAAELPSGTAVLATRESPLRVSNEPDWAAVEGVPEEGDSKDALVGAVADDVATGSPGHWILVVDDEPINRQVLKAQLGSAGFGVVEAADGQQALDVLRGGEHSFDLILLDVMMPRLSGFAACAALRKEFPAILLPVIFLTAKSQTEDVLSGFGVGGNDYLVKPFSRDELLARIRIHLELVTTHRLIRNYSKGLEDKVVARTRELVDMQQELVMRQKQAALGVLTAGVAHEINNPNNFVQVALQNTLAWKERFQGFVSELLAEDGDPEIRDAFMDQLGKLQEQLGLIEQGSRRIDGIVQGLRVISHLDQSQHEEVDPLEGLVQTVQLITPSVGEKVRFELHLHARPTLFCWPAELNQVYMNVLMNGVHAIADKQLPGPGRSFISSEAVDGVLEIVIADEGVGMTKDVLQRACDPFFTTREVGAGAGLGLSISREILQRHNGELLLVSEPGVGTRVTLRLPMITEFLDAAAGLAEKTGVV